MIGSRKLVHEENGGWHACTNGLRVARSAVESKLLTGIKAELRTPEYLEELKRGVRQALADVRSAHNSQRTARDKHLAELSSKIGHMVAAIAVGLFPPTLKSKLEAAEAERAAMASHLPELDIPTVATMSAVRLPGLWGFGSGGRLLRYPQEEGAAAAASLSRSRRLRTRQVRRRPQRPRGPRLAYRLPGI